MDLQSVFDRSVDITEPICQGIDAEKANMTIFDSFPGLKLGLKRITQSLLTVSSGN